MVKVTLTPPGGYADLVKIRQNSVPSIRKSSPTLSHQNHYQLVYPHPQNFRSSSPDFLDLKSTRFHPDIYRNVINKMNSGISEIVRVTPGIHPMLHRPFMIFLIFCWMAILNLEILVIHPFHVSVGDKWCVYVSSLFWLGSLDCLGYHCFCNYLWCFWYQ